MTPSKAAAPVRIEQRIRQLRGQKVMLDSDLASLYGVTTKVLLQAVKRNIARFPDDFMFQLDAAEWECLRSQIVTSNAGRGGRRYVPYAFTEQGVAMLSSVLGSARAAQEASDRVRHSRGQGRQAQGSQAKIDHGEDV